MIDDGIYVPTLLERLTGACPAASMGAIGGASKSDAKRAVSKANGAKGGRPRKGDVARKKAAATSNVAAL